MPRPGTHANTPSGGGRAGCRYRQALVGRQSHLRGAQIRPHRRLCGAQQARSAPRRQGAAAGCARQCPNGGRAGRRYRQALVGRQSHLQGAQIRPHRRLRGAQQARSAPRTNVRELFCGSKITRNDSDEAERRERSPSGVVSAANVEELAAAGGQVSGEAAPASGSASQVHVSLSPDGEVRRAQPGPPEPSAGRQSRAHYPPGTTPVLAFKSCYLPGSLPVLDVMQSRV